MSLPQAASGIAIVGLGMTAMSPSATRTTLDLAGEAIALALADAGLQKRDVDGLLVTSEQQLIEAQRELPAGTVAPDAARPLIQLAHGFETLSLFNVLDTGAASAATMVRYAALAIEAGSARTIVLAHAAEPASGPAPNDGLPRTGLASLQSAYGSEGTLWERAAAARRHMHLFGTESRQLGAIAVAQRAWARLDPSAQLRDPLELEDHQSSSLVADPLRQLDLAIGSSGAIAMVLTAVARAGAGDAPVFVRGSGQAAGGENGRVERDRWVQTGAGPALRTALRRADVSLDEIHVLQLQDPDTYTVLVTLEDYGLCAKGEGGAFVADGRTGPQGSLPVNTGGGSLSGRNAWDFTPFAEAVVQLRGQAGARQLEPHELALVGSTAGVMQFHAATVLGLSPSPVGAPA